MKNEQSGSNPPNGMPQANSHSTWALDSQGGYRWHLADCGRRYATCVADPRILSWSTETDLRTDSLHQSDAPLGL